MLEAREACSGATGRNGGHINPLLYTEYPTIKRELGVNVAKQIIRFRLSHFPQILAAATEENLLEDSQCREVQTFDVYHDSTLYQSAKLELAIYRRDLPMESRNYKCYEGANDIKRLQLSDQTAGSFSTVAGAVHPYRLVTGILSRLLGSYPSNFQLFTYTPCTTISEPDSSTPLYRVTTPKGVIQTPHIIHATNGWLSHLVPQMRGRIIPVRGVVTAQKPPKDLGMAPKVAPAPIESWTGTRSFVFYPETSRHTLHYLTQQPAPPGASSIEQDINKLNGYPFPSRELMLGGWLSSNWQTDIGVADDSGWNIETRDYLSHAIGKFFAVEDIDGDQTHMIAHWGGIMGASVDNMPWVGRIPENITRRIAPQSQMLVNRKIDTKLTEIHETLSSEETIAESLPKASARLAAPGEWLAAGYSGEGMVHAWMSAKALAYMVLGLDKDHMESSDELGVTDGSVGEWFPDVFRLTEERWENTGLEDLIAGAVCRSQ